MQGVPRTLPDCFNQASLAEVSQFRTKKEYCSQSRPTGTSLSTLAGNFRPLVQSSDRSRRFGDLVMATNGVRGDQVARADAFPRRFPLESDLGRRGMWGW